MEKKVKFEIILKNLTILYIEDEVNIRQNVKQTLSIFFKEVIDIETIEEANNIFYDRNDIDIILSDINVNDSNSLEFVEKIRQNDKKIPIIIVSAYTDKNYLLQATKLKLTDYLVKPINFEQLMSSFKKAVVEIEDNKSLIISLNKKIIFNIFDNHLFDTFSHKNIHLTSKELKLLRFLIENRDKVVSKEEIKNSVWEFTEDATDSAFKNLFGKLRNKIGKDSIINYPKVGYKLNID